MLDSHKVWLCIVHLFRYERSLETNRSTKSSSLHRVIYSTSTFYQCSCCRLLKEGVFSVPPKPLSLAEMSCNGSICTSDMNTPPVSQTGIICQTILNPASCRRIVHVLGTFLTALKAESCQIRSYKT